MREADGEDRKEDENGRVGKSAGDLDEDDDDDDVRLRDSLLSLSHAVYDVSGIGLVPGLRYSGVRATKCECGRTNIQFQGFTNYTIMIHFAANGVKFSARRVAAQCVYGANAANSVNSVSVKISLAGYIHGAKRRSDRQLSPVFTFVGVQRKGRLFLPSPLLAWEF